ncbi:hypothetical protein ABDI27_21450 [Bacillus mycoides]|uniref:hypothetical protein n=1 Tax=Bacillus mycoides TaxID=1405 RepID=UPI003D232619
MFISGSAIIVDVNIELNKVIKNISFQENEEFYSLTLSKENPSMGTIHWTKSFKYGTMNILHFLITNNKVILFTSAIQNFIYLQKILDRLSSVSCTVSILRLPLPVPKNKDLSSIHEISSYEIDDIFGIDSLIKLESSSILLKIFTNGLISYTMTNNENEVTKIIEITIKILEVFNAEY